MGILSGALAVFAMREMRDNAMEKSPGAAANMTSSFYGIPAGGGASEMQRKVSFFPAASSTADHSRRLSNEQQLASQNDSPSEKQVKTFTAATGLIETTF